MSLAVRFRLDKADGVMSSRLPRPQAEMHSAGFGSLNARTIIHTVQINAYSIPYSVLTLYLVPRTSFMIHLDQPKTVESAPICAHSSTVTVSYGYMSTQRRTQYNEVENAMICGAIRFEGMLGSP
jgi:hypothetical protein